MIGGSNIEAILETFSASTAKDITLNLTKSKVGDEDVERMLQIFQGDY